MIYHYNFVSFTGKSPQQKMPNEQAESQPWDTKFKQNDKPWNFS